MPRRDASKRIDAAKIYLNTGNLSETARQVGLDRSTVSRWAKDPEWLKEGAPPPEALSSLIPKALGVLDDALEGKRITSSQIRAAIEIARSSNALKASTLVEKTQSLLDVIDELDKGDDFSDSD